MLVQSARVDQCKNRPLAHACREDILWEANVENVDWQILGQVDVIFTFSLFHGHMGSFSAIGHGMSIVAR
jgi:hypothetical protein